MTRDQSKFTAAMERLFKDPQPVQIQISKQELWCFLCAIQLACRHPRFNGPTRKITEATARQLGAVLIANDPDLKMLFEMGWQEQFDDKENGLNKPKPE